MELTEISGNIHLCFKDLTFDLPVCASVEHTAMLDSESEQSFDKTFEQYLKQLQTAVKLHNVGEPFDLYFSVFGNNLSDPPNCEPQSLYYCHVQGWKNRLAVELALPGNKELITHECTSSSERTVSLAVYFAFGGFIFTCLDFKIKEIKLSDSYVADALDLYCLTNDKQLLLNELFNTEYILIHPHEETLKKE